MVRHSYCLAELEVWQQQRCLHPVLYDVKGAARGQAQRLQHPLEAPMRKAPADMKDA